ncbi:MAG: hypothetical protein PVF91_02135 [Chromatiales bacterium]|jgi:hypothetical protein
MAKKQVTRTQIEEIIREKYEERIDAAEDLYRDCRQLLIPGVQIFQTEHAGANWDILREDITGAEACQKMLHEVVDGLRLEYEVKS